MGINDLTRISPRGLIRGGGLICFKKILHGGLFEGGANLLQENFTWGLIKGGGLIRVWGLNRSITVYIYQ